MRRAPPPPQELSARDEALLRYRRSLSSAWRNSCYFLDAEPAAKRYPEVTFVSYRDRDAVSEAKRADTGAARLARLAEANKKWFPSELTTKMLSSRRERRGNPRRGRQGVNDDDDPNVNDPNVTVWNEAIGAGFPGDRAQRLQSGRAARRDGDMSRLDRLARLEEGKNDSTAGSNRVSSRGAANGNAQPTKSSKKRAAVELEEDEDALPSERARETFRDGHSGREKKERRDSERLSGKPKPGEEDDDDVDHANGDEDDWDEEDDYQQGGNFDDDDGYDDDFQDDGEGGDAFF